MIKGFVLTPDTTIMGKKEFQTNKNVKRLITASPGADNGNTIRMKAPNLEQPSIMPDSSTSIGTLSKNDLSIQIVQGNPRIV